MSTLKPLKQSNSVSCGQTSVAMLINYFNDKSIDDLWIDNRYGFGLMYALETEIGASFLDLNLSREAIKTAFCPFILGAGYPLSSTGRGHIVAIESVVGETVTFCDPADGKRRTQSIDYFLNCEAYPQGSFIFTRHVTAPVSKVIHRLPLVINMHSGKIGIEVEREIVLKPGIIYNPTIQKTVMELIERL